MRVAVKIVCPGCQSATIGKFVRPGFMSPSFGKITCEGCGSGVAARLDRDPKIKGNVIVSPIVSDASVILKEMREQEVLHLAKDQE